MGPLAVREDVVERAERAVPRSGVQVFRPMLQHSRAALEAYAREHGLR